MGSGRDEAGRAAGIWGWEGGGEDARSLRERWEKRGGGGGMREPGLGPALDPKWAEGGEGEGSRQQRGLGPKDL